ncbi:MAG: serine/threonine-protein phosphatase [Myxococcales bacterium]|nr:serine/threonine-protein phosphatase [Myxococcales bacterium]
MRLIAWASTDVGRVRMSNEDSYLVDANLGLYLVADGMGGHAGGAHASAMCADVVNRVVRRGMARVAGLPPEEASQVINEILSASASEASARIFAQAQADRSLQGMGTTLTGILFYGNRGYIVHVGDSRAYLMRSGGARQLTSDHSWLNEQIEAGLLTEEEAQASDLKHIITRSVGFEQLVEADIITVPVSLGDVFLLCSDGMANYVSLDEIARLARDHHYSELPHICTELALDRGGDDNITVVVILACNDYDSRKPMRKLSKTVADTLPSIG